jgi:hypothetical protein
MMPSQSPTEVPTPAETPAPAKVPTPAVVWTVPSVIIRIIRIIEVIVDIPIERGRTVAQIPIEWRGYGYATAGASEAQYTSGVIAVFGGIVIGVVHLLTYGVRGIRTAVTSGATIIGIFIAPRRVVIGVARSGVRARCLLLCSSSLLRSSFLLRDKVEVVYLRLCAQRKAQKHGQK